MMIMGVLCFVLIFWAIFSTFGGVVFAFSARMFAACIVGPSAMGSEKGKPNSRMSTPPRIRALAIFGVNSGVGSPAVMYPMRHPLLFL